ncbi:DUF4232 domain-containing protein [Mycolicibacterium sp. GCM10028919]|uniref:DUF4232 domain-containing protein n=1 Tax=Mycolicibacterium sp. GCM10028919 TaxID=3273401 RepID=UPI003617718C
MNMWKMSLPVIAAAFLAGCASDPVTPAAESATTPAPTSAPAQMSTPPVTPPVTATVTAQPSPVAAEPEVTGPCADTDLVVSNEPLESQGSEYRLVLQFENVTSQACTLQGYPGADIVDADLPVVHVERRQQIAAPLLTLAPGDIATADLQASDVNRETEAPCGTWGQVVVIAPNALQQRQLDVGMPTCSALISSVT